MMSAAFALINQAALQHNLAIVRRHAPDANIMAVIKANAYGHGMLRMARMLAAAVDSLAVARTDEAVALREQGVTAPITVLQGFMGRDELMCYAEYQLTAVVHQHEQIQALLTASVPEKIAIWLKMDSGMSRLGFLPAEWQAVCARLQNSTRVQQPFGVMTHLASADEVGCRQSRQQLQRFDALTCQHVGAKSIANSAAVLACPEAVSDWVRPGLMLYGVSPFPDKSAADLGLKPVMTLQSRLISVKTVAPGETVGYGATWRCQHATRVGIVSIGYGDGYPRYAQNGTPVLINGKVVPLIGRVSMDMLAVDLSALPEAKIGDTATLWGEGLPVETIARYADTIPYTVLCGITARVEMIER